MQEQIQSRLEALKKELETGRDALEKVEQQRTYLQQMTLRIAGAIQVLEELLAEAQPARLRQNIPPDEIGPGVTQATFSQDHAINGQ